MENDTEFETKIKGDPFAMSEKIKLKMCNPSKVKCPCVALFEQLEMPLNAKQEDEEPPFKHTKRFKQAQDNVKLIVGTKWLEHFAESIRMHTRDRHKQAKATQG